MRDQNISPDYLGDIVVAAIRQHETDLEQGALVVIEVANNRVRILPI